MKAIIFATRNVKEILRDPMSYIFCLVFPIVMLVVFYAVFYSPEAYWFAIDILTPGIAIFSFSFTMLFMALLVSKDKTTAFLSRLYTSPMTTLDFVIGYTIPGLIITIGQVVACYITAAIIGLATGIQLSYIGITLAIISTIPAMFMFIGFGILFGSLFSDQAAPGISSIVITMSGFLSGAWMLVNPGTALSAIFSALPFYPAVSVGRIVLSLNETAFANIGGYLAIVCAYAVAVFSLSVVAFRKKTVSDSAIVSMHKRRVQKNGDA